jgi:hypothetical protein
MIRSAQYPVMIQFPSLRYLSISLKLLSNCCFSILTASNTTRYWKVATALERKSKRLLTMMYNTEPTAITERTITIILAACIPA